MRKLTVAALLLAFAGCTDSTDISLYIPFALFASDELSATSSGLCGFTPVTQSQGFYKSTGLLELDPNINSNPSYVLGLQLENYLDQTIIADSNGDTLSGPQRNNFNYKYAIINYLDVGGNLGSTPEVKVFLSGTVRPGGEQNAASVAVEAVSPQVAAIWRQSFDANSLSSDQVILSVQIFGELNTGERTQTGIFDFPLTVCQDCTGISPTAAPGTSNGCLNGSAPVPSGHGPCCNPQDFVEVCADCGASGQPCCPDFKGGKPFCNSSGTTTLTCTGAATTSSGELCNYPQQPFVVCSSSTT